MAKGRRDYLPGRRTLRGRVFSNSIKQLINSNGLLDDGWVVEKWFVWPRSSAVNADIHAVLSLDYDAPTDMRAEDNRQIGWGWLPATGSAYNFGESALLDPDHLVLQDLYISNTSAPPVELNYLIFLRRESVSDTQAVMSLIKSRSQDDRR
jgi:hypothetical protein